MKQTVVQIFEDSGHEYGQVSNPADLMKGQQYAHDHVGQVTHDFVNDAVDELVRGFDYELGTGNTFDVTIKRPGRVYTKDGVSYELLDDATVTLADPDDDNPRIDLIVAKLEDETPAELDLIPVVRLDVDEQTNFNKPTELHWRTTIEVKTGTPAAIPVAPTYDSNEIPLYAVTVPADVLTLRLELISDLREPIATLEQLNEYRDTDREDINRLLARVGILEAGAGDPTDPATEFGALIAELLRQIAASRDVPEIRYSRPKYALTDKRSGQILGTGGSASSVPHVDIDLGAVVNFGDAEKQILPQAFADQSLNPRYATVGTPSGHTRRDVTLNLAGVTQTSSDGGTGFALRNAALTVARSYGAAAARDSQHIEVFGGMAGGGSTALSDWYTYDIVNDTLTPRTPSVTLPASNAPALFPYGDGTHVLLIAGSQAGSQTPRCFKVNCSTMVVTEILTTLPTGCQFIGDLIATNKIFITAIKKVGGESVGTHAEYWEFDASADTFTQITPTGVTPLVSQYHTSGCYYDENKFVMVFGFNGNTGGPPHTYIYESTTTQWTEINIQQPYQSNGTTINNYEAFFRMANINGRPTLAGGDPSTKMWELVTSSTGLVWTRTGEQAYGYLSNQAFCSTIGSTSRANGKGFIAGGMKNGNFFQQTMATIYVSAQAGLIAAVYGGESGISVGEGSNTVQFEVPLYTADFQVAGYQADIVGSNLGSLLVELSLDDGDHWHTIELGRTFTVTDSDTPGARRLRVTMYRSGSTAPILTKLTEILDDTGGVLEDRQVIRFDTPTSGGPYALYIDRDGVVTLDDTIEESTSTKAIIMKITTHTTTTPDVKSYFNRRRAKLKYTGARASGTTPPFVNELAVSPRWVTAWAIKASDASNTVRKIADPTVAFDNDAVTVADLGTNADTYLVEIGI
jgi:hypothetical protein